MGIETDFPEVKLFCGVIYRQEDHYQQIKAELETTFSAVDLESPIIPFDFTTYYNAEMGTPLRRRFMAFGPLVPPETLPDIKLLTNRLEEQKADQGKRTVNLDPGYLSDANLIVATTKNYYHRIPLQKGIYAHMEYVFKNKKICFLDWTYPDFKSEAYRDFFHQLWRLYRQNLKDNK